MKGNQRIVLLVAAVAVLVVGFSVARPEDGSKKKAAGPAVDNFKVVVSGGKPAGGTRSSGRATGTRST